MVNFTFTFTLLCRLQAWWTIAKEGYSSSVNLDPQTCSLVCHSMCQLSDYPLSILSAIFQVNQG